MLFRDTSSEAVRTLLAYGYTIEAPTSETGESGMTGVCLTNAFRAHLTSRTYSPLFIIAIFCARIGGASVGTRLG